MIGYVTLGTRDLPRAAAFYDKIAAELGPVTAVLHGAGRNGPAVYALSATGNTMTEQLTPMIAQGWSLATAFSLLAWYVFAPQCISTLSIVKRETNSMRYPLLMAGYLFALAYVAAFVTYRVTLALTGG